MGIPIKRDGFIKGSAASLFAGALDIAAVRTARATGGLDVWPDPGTVGPAQMRILICADRGAEVPQLADGGIFTFASKRWRGTPSIVALPGGKSGVVAAVDVDDYLYGVLPIEASPGWPPEALAAQAIVARTFALSRRNLARPYDLVVSQNDQRFGGIEAEFPATNAAVDATRNTVVTFAGENASVFYSSCCGGHTADAATIWGHSALPYLRGVADPYCVAAPDYRWQRSVALERVQAALAARVPGEITGFTLGPADSGGRPLSIDVLTRDGPTTLSASDFRAAIGAEIVRSPWIQALQLAPPQVNIQGAGRGHGVGFCQWGARALGAAGSTAATILAFYFPGTRIAAVDAGER
ncbi:MAG: SpoIID/LytB domain-containing protein [Candidatus Velthaea sp.]